MRDEIKTVLVCAFFVLMWVSHTCTARSEDPDVALWLARSCTGEAGWLSHETGECAAIMHVYRKRGEMHGRGTLWVARRYSAAIKPGTHHRNAWVRHLRRDGQQPDHWPLRLPWERYAPAWRAMLAHADAFVQGDVPDPLPAAVHYGGSIDAHRVPATWRRIRCGFRNWFYEVRTRTPGPLSSPRSAVE